MEDRGSVKIKSIKSTLLARSTLVDVFGNCAIIVV
jgi:hypothetical protein